MLDELNGSLGVEAKQKLIRFKEYAVSHPQLLQVDRVLMRAVREPAGFAHVLVYGPSGVGKTTMICQMARRLNGALMVPVASNEPLYRNESLPPVPLLLLETRQERCRSVQSS